MLKAPEINYYIGESQIIPTNTVRYSAAKRQQISKFARDTS